MRSLLATLAVLAAASGCNVGPKYEPPRVVVPTGFKERASGGALPAGTWQPARPQDTLPKGRWWTIFDDAELDALETQLDADNLTIAVAFQSFMAARAQVDQARAGYFPTVTLGASATHSSASGRGANAVTSNAVTSQGVRGTFFSIPLEASWAPDLWGRVRNAVRAARNAAQVSAADLANVRLMQQGSLATYFFELRGQDELAELYERTIRADQASLELTRAQFETGIGTEEAVAQAEVTLANARAAGIALATSRATYEHAIATLIGRPASSFAMPRKALTATPPAIPIGIPSDLLQRRPDIAAAERTLAQTNAQIGVAMAAYYPSLTLAASGALTATTLGVLFATPAFIWSASASASELLFEGGLRRATIAQYSAVYEGQVATYRQTVLEAFQQVEDQLASLRVLSQQLVEQQRAVAAARRYLELALSRFETGVGPYLEVITAQTLLLGAEQSAVTARVSSMTSAISLVGALGGGWDASRLATP